MLTILVKLHVDVYMQCFMYVYMYMYMYMYMYIDLYIKYYKGRQNIQSWSPHVLLHIFVCVII